MFYKDKAAKSLKNRGYSFTNYDKNCSNFFCCFGIKPAKQDFKISHLIRKNGFETLDAVIYNLLILTNYSSKSSIFCYFTKDINIFDIFIGSGAYGIVLDSYRNSLANSCIPRY